MRCADDPTTRELANQLLACEEVRITSATSDMHAVVRVCGKLRRPLARLAGAAGFHSLLARALNVANQESTALAKWEIKPDGSLQVIDGETAQAGAVLLAHLLGLMITFIGESLTLRLLHDVWLGLPDDQAKVERKK